MAIVKQKDSRSGITYVYESVSWYDKESKNARSKRRLLGRWDEEKGIVVPTDGRGRKNKSVTSEKAVTEKKKNSIDEDTYELLYKQAIVEIHSLKEENRQQQLRIAELEAQLK